MPLIAILRCTGVPEIKVRQHSREDIKVIYDPGRCYENLPFYFFFYFLFSKNPRLCTLDPRHVTLDPRLCTLDPRPSTKTQTPNISDFTFNDRFFPSSVAMNIDP